jgi:hypothetical protein
MHAHFSAELIFSCSSLDPNLFVETLSDVNTLPKLTGIVITSSLEVAFNGIDFALLVGARPRGPGMERKDLLRANAEIFREQGTALEKYASRNVKVQTPFILIIMISFCLYALFLFFLCVQPITQPITCIITH